MIIKLTEGLDAYAGTWTLWATETDDATATPIYMARKRSGAQILALVRTIMNEAPQRPEKPVMASELVEAKRRALGAVLEALDGWIENARDNHEASGHRGESRGEECWRSFAPDDLRNMINDAARDVGLNEFPKPKNPPEDQK